MTISTRNLASLPDIDSLFRLVQSLAMLDAIISPGMGVPLFFVNTRWAPGEEMGSMRNGSGDGYFALFNSAGCWLKGFDHESIMSPFNFEPAVPVAGVFDGVPVQFARCLEEPAFAIPETTFCVWRTYADTEWHHGPVTLLDDHPDPDGSAHLLRWLDGQPGTYHEWAEGYHERAISRAAVEAVFAHHPLNDRLVRELNTEASIVNVEEDVKEIGYPTQ